MKDTKGQKINIKSGFAEFNTVVKAMKSECECTRTNSMCGTGDC